MSEPLTLSFTTHSANNTTESRSVATIHTYTQNRHLACCAICFFSNTQATFCTAFMFVKSSVLSNWRFSSGAGVGTWGLRVCIAREEEAIAQGKLGSVTELRTTGNKLRDDSRWRPGCGASRHKHLNVTCATFALAHTPDRFIHSLSVGVYDEPGRGCSNANDPKILKN